MQKMEDMAGMNRATLTGTIEIDGSSTVFPITEAVAEEFRKEAPQVRVNVGVSGSGGGFKRFTAGETDISDASRPIKDGEAAAATENGIEYYEFLVGVDGLSVMVSPKNDFVDCMTVEQLHELWKPGSSVSKWSDIDPSWPDSDINLYGPGTDSGTFDYFTEEINGEAQASRADYTASEDDNVLVQRRHQRRPQRAGILRIRVLCRERRQDEAARCGQRLRLRNPVGRDDCFRRLQPAFQAAVHIREQDELGEAGGAGVHSLLHGARARAYARGGLRAAD